MEKTSNIRKVLTLALLFVSGSLFAQVPSGYYAKADGKKGATLKTALSEIVSASAKTISYDGLWEAYKTTDLRPDGKIWDMYSNATNYDPDRGHSGNYSKEGDMYNREHSFPKSWFNEGSPMSSDLVHVVPTDGYVNNRRSNYPFGEVASATYQSKGGFSKLGSCDSKIGYSGTVFEPNDEYKGDFARIYFYMVTRYESQVSSWSSPMLAGNKYPAYKDWAIKMLLRWAAEDPVSQKEIDRNNGVYKCQKNRNPFVDFPGLEQYVWGTHKDVPLDVDDYKQPDGTTPGNPGGGDDNPGGDNPGGDNPGGSDNPSATYTKFEKITSTSDLSVGGKYLIVCEDKNTAMAENSNNVRTLVDVKIANYIIETTTGEGKAHAFILGGKQGAYTLQDETDKTYLALTANDNKLHSVEELADKNSEWDITFNQGNAVIKNQNYTDRTIQYNASSPRFACYKSAQQPVQLFKGVSTDSGPTSIGNATVVGRTNIICTLSGQRVGKITKAGVYIVNGKKVLVK